ncbi:exodeoxyribonuclease V subunit gamma, partial [Caldilinea sp.]|uniref:exodeoxyribonuclease V subunit gamma n=1 Tax=Caldilinea sp. TaxID=2293560 RepID=UPI002C82DA81|nr:exodeoxyribonuclease V subunit gamma [Caldilinea sp.]
GAVPRDSPLDKMPLTWRLMQVLPGLLALPEFAPVQGYLRPQEPDRWIQLAARLADLLDQYQNYRTDWLQLWMQGRHELIRADGTHEPLPADQRWQAMLWPAVVQTLDERQQSLRTWLGGGDPLHEADEAGFWAAARAFAWAPADWSLVKTPITLHTIPVLEQILQANGAQRRYLASGALVWIAWPGDLVPLDDYLTQLQLGGLVLRGETQWPFVGARTGASLAARVKRVLDPTTRFPIL